MYGERQSVKSERVQEFLSLREGMLVWVWVWVRGCVGGVQPVHGALEVEEPERHVRVVDRGHRLVLAWHGLKGEARARREEDVLLARGVLLRVCVRCTHHQRHTT